MSVNPSISGSLVTSGLQVTTVTGKMPVEDMGITLMHEHLFVDALSAVSEPVDSESELLYDAPIRIENLALLRENPYASLENCYSDSVREAEVELTDFQDLGGSTIVEVTAWNGGRSPEKLAEVANRTSVNIIMGTGLYLERSHPDWVQDADVETIAERIVEEANHGVDGISIRPGIIGEIGISPAFTSAEEKSLRAASRAQTRTGLPLMIHLPAWKRYAHRVLDICEQEGVDPKAVILAHMDPSFDDWNYQLSLAKRQAHLEFDGIGMGLYYRDEGQCPCDDEISQAVVRLYSAGYGDRLVLSHDVFLKIQRRTYGGNGYGHILRSFLPRLKRMGMNEAERLALVTKNPWRVFTEAAE